MAITVDGVTYRTLNDYIFVDDKRIVEVYVDNVKVYPDSDKPYSIHMHMIRPRTRQTHHMKYRAYNFDVHTDDELLRYLTTSLGVSEWEVTGERKVEGMSTIPGYGRVSVAYEPYRDPVDGNIALYGLEITSEHTATYMGEIDVTISSTKPFPTFDSLREYYGNNNVDIASGYHSDGYGYPIRYDSYGNVAGGIAFSGQPFAIDDAQKVRYAIMLEDMVKYPMIEVGSVIDVTVTGTASCDYRFHGESSSIQTLGSAMMTSFYSSCQGDISESCHDYMVEKSSERQLYLNGIKTVAIGSEVSGSVYVFDKEYVLMTDLILYAPPHGELTESSTMLCPFEANGYDIIS